MSTVNQHPSSQQRKGHTTRTDNGGCTTSSRFNILYPFIAFIGLYQFTTSFFLAKKSMSHISQCNKDTASLLLQNEIGLSSTDIQYLHKFGILSTHYSQTDGSSNDSGSDGSSISDGCWMPRRVDAMAVVVVDALRFDFALQHLPKSVGARLTYERQGGSSSISSTTTDTDTDTTTTTDNTGTNTEAKGDENEKKPRGQSQLFKFVADPPTVTMQRLKGLTTGGLPTFADISGSFGGANVDEDSWVQQLHDVPISKRGLDRFFDHGKKNRSRNDNDNDHDNDNERTVRMAFVGDDTWTDLFPNQFDDSHPFPSFNTRDLDTVDNGCLLHLPRLLKSFGSSTMTKSSSSTTTAKKSYFEMIVTHFLGVDHVGHTYGPNNKYMDQKLNQMDDVLQSIFLKIDDATEKCHVVFVFGDHGMTDDGNHGGGTEEEINAGLFAHYSPGCGDLGPSLDITGVEVGSHVEEAFQSINQIDLVPTISYLLGLPIPFANLGGVAPGLLPPLHYHSDENIVEAPYVATALALNAAQVWNYLTTYSTTANKLPDEALSDLNEMLQRASSRFKEALAQQDSFDSNAYREACGLFKYFLSQASDLGKQIWTKFDTRGMGIGIVLLVLALFLGVPFTLKNIFCIKETLLKVLKKIPSSKTEHFLAKGVIIEGLSIIIVIIFHCVLLTFSNSYIITEEYIIMFFLFMLCLMTSIHHSLNIAYTSESGTNTLFARWNDFMPLLIALCSRLHQLLVTGHGKDPMIREHWAHQTGIFLISLVGLVLMRIYYFVKKSFHLQLSKTHTSLDIATMLFLGYSWIEKRSPDTNRHGYLSSRMAMILCAIGVSMLAIQWSRERVSHGLQLRTNSDYLHKTLMVLIKVLLFIVTVTGPSTATSCIIVIIQVCALSRLTFAGGNYLRGAPLLALLWRLSIRHVFFVTGHACSFNRLQFTAAFVATEIFYYSNAGTALFFNTFGWDILGIILVATLSRAANRHDVWRYFCFYQLIETVFSCISVTLMRRHLMVWAIFAPRFVFATIFLLLSLTYCLLDNFVIKKLGGNEGYDAKNKSRNMPKDM